MNIVIKSNHHLIERVEVEKESLLRELEKTPEMEMMRARAQGEVERFKRENSRLAARIGEFFQYWNEFHVSLIGYYY